MIQSQGYGSVSLSGKIENADLTVNFFNSDLSPWNPGVLSREKEPPKYIFISNLGLYDYYQNVGSERNSSGYIGDIFWEFEKCNF